MTSTDAFDVLASHKPHRYPWWLAFLLTSPMRRWIDEPSIILGDLVQTGQTVLELGPANGYFSVPIAEALGPDGKLIAVDIQPQMLQMLSKRLKVRGLERCLVTRLTKIVEEQLADLSNSVNLIVAINVIHELPKPRETIFALAEALKEGGQFLLVEPRRHVSHLLYEAELAWAREAGLQSVANQDAARSKGFRARLQKVSTSARG